MKSLIWKDYRLSRSLLLLFAAIWVLMYLVGIGTQLATTWPRLPSLDDWAGMLHSYGAAWLYLTMCFAGLLGGHAIAARLSSEPVDDVGELVTASGIGSVCVLTFGVGWMASAMLEKTTVPILLALLSPVAVSIALILVGSVIGISSVRVSDWSNLVCFVVGSVAFAEETWHYCRRVEP